MRYESDRIVEAHWQAEQAFVERYFDGILTPVRILDVPVGTGRFLGIYPVGAEVYGVDVSPAMLAEAQKKSSRGVVRLFEGDVTHLNSVADSSVDVIVCFRMLHLFASNDRRAMLREFARVLHGRLLLQAYVSAPAHRRIAHGLRSRVGVLFRRLKAVFCSSSHTPWGHIQSYPISMEEVSDLLAGVGLRIQCVHTLGSYHQQEILVIEAVCCGQGND